MPPISVFQRCLALLLAGLAQGSAMANGLPEIEYATPDQSIWTTRINSEGEPDNPLTPVAATLFAKAGIPWHVRAYPAARMFKYLRDGTAQFSILVKSAALEECCLLSRKLLAVAEIRVYHLAGIAPIKGMEDLLDKKVITIHGYSYGGLLNSLGKDNRMGDNLAPTHPAAFRMLTQGRADYLIDYADPAAEVLAATPLPGLQSELLSHQEVYLVLSKRYPEAENLMGRLENIAKTLDVGKLMRRNRK
jgi:ABC-type amino acid transport substrate-binding protein